MMLDYILIGAAALLVLSFLVDTKKIVSWFSPPKVGMDCLLSIVSAMDTCEKHGHTELAEKLEALLPEAAKCIRGHK